MRMSLGAKKSHTGLSSISMPTEGSLRSRSSIALKVTRPCDTHAPHPEEVACPCMRPSRRMVASAGLAAILRDALRSPSGDRNAPQDEAGIFLPIPNGCARASQHRDLAAVEIDGG